MKTKILLFMLFFITFLSQCVFSQIENVPLNNPVYEYLKEMRVKRIITQLNDDDPNLSRFHVTHKLKEIQSKKSQLSTTEKSLLRKYMIEFNPEEINTRTTASMFKSNMNVSNGFKYIFSDKEKYLFTYQKNKNNVFINGLGHLFYANEIKPSTKPNSKLFDGGFRIRGSLFEHLGYNFSVEKGGAVGDSILIESVFPEIKSNFKYLENTENIVNYDFTNGYLKYYFEPSEGMGISAQLGREKLKYGYGYSKSLTLSGDAPNMDFLKFVFDYGIINFSSIFASTVGEFNTSRDERYIKYFSANRLKLSFENLFDVGIGESIISSSGIQLGYINPLIFYKFVEHSLQDRDNGTIFFELQTHFLKDLELQGTFFLDENILSNLSDFDKTSNKSAYQLGFFWYEPAGLKNLSLIFEYTKIRPYVYSHFDPKNTYTAFGVIIGHPIGPNADQIFTKLAYNLTDRLSFNLEYQHIRKGENIYNGNGELIENVGGNVYDSYRQGIDSQKAIFLNGIRLNEDIVKFNVSFEPIKNYIFDLNYVYDISKNLTNGVTSDLSYAFARFSLGY
ncbi:MAG: capsule assembly Wzi family protein [Bacteroidota bacterium]|nr:capsule assembly Wzi family protein [Bacteroidota bacterium]